CLYDENRKLLQTFPCGIAAEELVFRFDRLSHDYGYDADLIVFPAGAPETGADGLCYQWQREKQRFVEAPVTMPWYQEGSVRDKAFLVLEAEESVQTNIICRINEESRSVVELRKWTLCKNEETGEESLCICDCLEGQDIYSGKVKRYETGDLVNEKYYQYLFWNGLKDFWSPKKNEPIWVQKVVQGKGLVNAEYRDKKDFLADYGFAQTEPFYEYYDQFHNLIMELYFNPQTGQGCGICFHYYFNYELEKVASREGFVLDETRTAFWKPQDIFSRLSISGEDLREYHIPGYREIYEYTDDGRLSFFEARGIDECEHESVEVSLLSMDYIYRSDGTLCHKVYHHYPMLFSTTCQWQCSDYDEQERLVYCSAYITHGMLEYFYIYGGDSSIPAYCLEFDHGGSPPVMVAYDRGN
ncbi:MAG: hypothetical protein K2H37_08070, partial [Lachnospiraceae bacterium]|nr:hypothetical protein [Lachnospiraceae bacterium]